MQDHGNAPMDHTFWKKYFHDRADEWLDTSYGQDTRFYPTALHRIRMVTALMAFNGEKLKLADLGCGDGRLAVALARQGHAVTGLDRSERMIALAMKRRSGEARDVADRLVFRRATLHDHGLEPGSLDGLTCMGVIGYLDHDEVLFQIAADLIRIGGILVVSFRNRLFNMVSLTHRTLREIREGNALALLEEIGSCYQQVAAQQWRDFFQRLTQAVNKVSLSSLEDLSDLPVERTMGRCEKHEPRQSTPRAAVQTAGRFGFREKAMVGVHPHLLDPGMSRLLPPEIAHGLDSALEALELTPLALVRSSVFIGAFIKDA